MSDIWEFKLHDNSGSRKQTSFFKTNIKEGRMAICIIQPSKANLLLTIKTVPVDMPNNCVVKEYLHS